MRIDERTAAFLALGLAKASGRPVPVLTTSGTAAAHLHAAVLEADASGVPLLALTADRPPELRATGANQTIEQAGLYGGAVRWAADVGVPEAGREEAQNRYWRSLVAKALITATGALSGDPGPVHLNLALREPLLPDDEDGELDRPVGGAAGRRAVDGGRSARAGRSRRRAGWPAADAGRRSATARRARAGRARSCAEALRLAGDRRAEQRHRGARGGAARRRAAARRAPTGWPRTGPTACSSSGRPTLSRPVSALLADPGVRVETVDRARRAGPTPVRASAGVGRGFCRRTGRRGGRRRWAAAWQRGGGRVGAAVDAVLDARAGA